MSTTSASATMQNTSVSSAGSNNPARPGKPGKVKKQVFRIPENPSSLGAKLFFGTAFFFVFYGWLYHENFYLSAETGAGYILGIVGGVFMLILLLYPLRKKYRVLHRMGSMKAWFMIHMALGVIGPVLILYHANFSLGSVNSNIALFCMIAVALSGFVGRFIYRHIHFGMYGHKATLEELKENLELTMEMIGVRFGSLPTIRATLSALENASSKRRNFLFQLIWLPALSIRVFVLRKNVKRLLKMEMRIHKNSMDQVDLDIFRESLRGIYYYIETTKKLGQLATYERLFALWHILHLPLFFMLIITGIVHVVAVHMY